MAGDTFYNPDPLTAGTAGDVYQNTIGGGDVWFDVVSHWQQDTSWDIRNETLQGIAWDIKNEFNQDIAWDILNAFAQNIAWDVLNSMDQDFSWSVFAETLYFLRQFFVKSICFNYDIDEPINFTKNVLEPLVFTYYSADVIDETINLTGEFAFDTINIASAPQYDFQIIVPVAWTFNVPIIFGAGSEDFVKGN